MESGGTTRGSAVRGANALAGTAPRRAAGLRVYHIQAYRACDLLSEGLIYLMVLFGPWAFGTTQTWSIWTMNLAGYTLGVLLALKWFIRRFTLYRPPRWEADPAGGFPSPRPSPHQMGRGRRHACRDGSFVLGALTLVLLAYTLISALNARSTYSAESQQFVSHQYIPWLPHSLDSTATWFAFWKYLGLAAAFWAIRDWLLSKSQAECGIRNAECGMESEERGRRAEDRGPGARERRSVETGQGTKPVTTCNLQPATCNLPTTPSHNSQLSTLNSQLSLPLPARLRRLLWLLALNGALLGLEGIVQRLENCPKLLFLVQPRLNSMTEAQFGPYAYRSNAAQYFNLLWPVCLGFWWTLNRWAGRRRTVHHLLLLCAAIMAACPIISTTRAGAIVSVGMALLGGLLLLAMYWFFGSGKGRTPLRWFTLGGFGLFLTIFLGLGYSLGWKALQPRLAQLQEGYDGRERIHQAARRMADDYPLFGIGPGAYQSVSELYRPPGDQFMNAWSWPAHAHNDFLETQITFGWIGSAFIYLALACVLGRWFVRGGIHGGRRFIFLIWLALAGCFVQARFDFPFQIHSILFLFLLLCALLSVLSRRGERS